MMRLHGHRYQNVGLCTVLYESEFTSKIYAIACYFTHKLFDDHFFSWTLPL